MMKRSVHAQNVVVILMLMLLAFNVTHAQTSSPRILPELVFKNPKLIDGPAKKPGAVYKFKNVANGVDATIRLVAFSHPEIFLQDIDATNMGYDNAFQPYCGLPGNVSENMNWYVDFQLTFYAAGTNDSLVIDRFTATALNIDGDNLSLKEYVKMFEASSVSLTNNTMLIRQASTPVLCKKCGAAGLSVPCAVCNASGYLNNGTLKCSNCNGTGLIFGSCGHPWTGADLFTQANTTEFTGIDTTQTQNMATFTYNNVSTIKFRYGGTTGALKSKEGERLNSMWFKGFSLSSTQRTLPVKLISFDALEDNNNISLQWSTASEINFSHFLLQKSTDNQHYSDVALIFSNGGSELTNYSYKDKAVLSSSGILYYRLVEVDINGQASYSPIRAVRLNNAEKTLNLYVYPNPVQDLLKIVWPLTWQNKPVMIEIVNEESAVINKIQYINAGTTESVRLDGIRSGFYLIRATCNGQTASQHILKR